MAVINTQARGKKTDGEFPLLETDVYRMKIARASIEQNQYADDLPDGTKPDQLVLCWEVTQATPDQDEEVVGLSVWQRMNPYYGPVRDGGVSKFKQFIDMLRGQGHLEEFDPNAFDTDALLGIEQRVSVEQYIKSQGVNVGKPGNKVTGVLPLRPAKKAAATAKTAKGSDSEDLF
jgi:hypothetical protein